MEEQRKVSCPSGEEITSLPEDIQTHIVSLLPMEDAFRTSVLSKQWRSICASIPNLNFDQTSFEQKPHSMSFKDFVNDIFPLRTGLNIQKFNLVATVDDSSLPHIHSWISSVICHNVQELRLFFSKNIEKLPFDLFTSRTLRVLNLNHVDLHPPSTIELPLLKNLRLFYVNFHSSTPPSELISASPALEEFTMLACSWENINAAVVVASLSLKSLTLNVMNPNTVIMISAPTLHTINYTGKPPYITQKTLSSLSIADFQFTAPFGSDISILENLGRNASNLLRGLRYLERLKLRFFFVEYITRVPDLFACWRHPYASLKDLKLEMFRTKNHTNFIIFLLKMHLNLQTLSISVKPKVTDTETIKVGRYLPFKDLSSEGILKQLKIVEIGDFEGSGCELDLVKYLLVNASMMEVMHIRYSNKLHLEEYWAMRMILSETVLAFPQVSPALVVLFH